MGKLGGWELLILLLIVVVLFGAGRLAGIGKGLGEGIRNFRKALRGNGDEPERPEQGQGENVEKKRT